MRRKFLIAIITCVSSAAFLLVASSMAIVVDGLTDEIHKADVAVVLGNEVKKDGRPSARLQARLQKSLDLYQQGYVPRIIVSGGKGKSGFDEAIVMANWLIKNKVPDSAIIIDSQGSNTLATGRNASRIMRDRKMKSAVVVTQYFHVSRSKLALHRYGVSPVYGAHAPVLEWRDPYSIPR